MEEKVFGLPAGLLANSMIAILIAISIILLFGPGKYLSLDFWVQRK